MNFEINKYADLVWTNEKGLCHREKGPALICTDGHIEYRVEHRRHRLDGPAIIRPSGGKFYYIYDIHYTKEEYYAKVKQL